MKNVLVTGGAGYIGSHIIEQLIKKGLKVFIIDNLSTGHKRLLNKRAKFFKLNINQYKKVNELIKKYNIDSLIHLAAKLSVSEGEKKPKLYYRNNVKGTSNLLKAIKNTKVKNFIFSSTCAVYSDKLPYVNESSKTNPKSVYGLTKLKCEKLIKKNFNKNYAILRYFNVVGASSSMKIGQINRNGQLFKNFSIAIKRKNPTFNIYGNDYKTFDGTCVRDYIHVSDLADIHIKTLMKVDDLNKSIILNCGYGKGFSVFEVVREFMKFSRNKVKINIKKRRKGDMVKIVAKSKKLKQFLKWKPKHYNLNKMVKSSIYWERKLVRTN